MDEGTIKWKDISNREHVMGIMSGIPNEKPIWFCGNAEEWKIAAGAARTLGGADYLDKISSSKDTSTGTDNSDSMSKITEAGLVIGILAGGISGVAGTLAYSELHWILTGLGAVLAGGIGCVAGGLTGFASGGIGAVLTSGVMAPLVKKIRGESEGDLIEMGMTVGSERVAEICKVTQRAMHKISKEEGMDKELHILHSVASGMEKLAALTAETERKIKAENTKDERLARVAHELRKEAPKAFKEEKEEVFAISSLEGRLAALGDLGSEGLAAVTLWNSLKDLGANEESERRAALNDRIPRLLEAYFAVPEESRGKPISILEGETPEGSLRRGLAAALESVMDTKRRLTERAAVGVEAEARVLEESRPRLKV